MPVHPRAVHPRAARDERGAVTAEAAMALPVLVLFTLAMAWLVGLGVTQVRALDAAREGFTTAVLTDLAAGVAPTSTDAALAAMREAGVRVD